jgi:hypothetical protein
VSVPAWVRAYFKILLLYVIPLVLIILSLTVWDNLLVTIISASWIISSFLIFELPKPLYEE